MLCKAEAWTVWSKGSDDRPRDDAWRSTRASPSVVEHRFIGETIHRGRPWIVIVEPDPDERRLVIVTVYESQR